MTLELAWSRRCSARSEASPRARSMGDIELIHREVRDALHLTPGIAHFRRAFIRNGYGAWCVQLHLDFSRPVCGHGPRHCPGSRRRTTADRADRLRGPAAHVRPAPAAGAADGSGGEHAALPVRTAGSMRRSPITTRWPTPMAMRWCIRTASISAGPTGGARSVPDRTGVDDVGFIVALVDRLTAEYRIPAGRVFGDRAVGGRVHGQPAGV